jgi:hypothetical protein
MPVNTGFYWRLGETFNEIFNGFSSRSLAGQNSAPGVSGNHGSDHLRPAGGGNGTPPVFQIRLGDGMD